jgi:CO/xanthine dehydrogenase Mo-binding subunit
MAVDGFRVIGRSVPRPDAPAKVAGLTRFAGDLQRPGLLHARLVLSPHAHARIVGIDTAAARALDGVVAVFTARDLPIPDPDAGDRNRAPLAIDRVLFNGHPVAAVVARTEAIAEDAAQRVVVRYEELPAVVDPFAALAPDAPRVGEPDAEGDGEELGMHGGEDGGQTLDEPKGPNVASTSHFTRGDVARGLRESDVVVAHRYATSVIHQGYLEPQAALAEVDALGHVTVWSSTQALFFARAEVAAALGLPESRVRMVATPIGGGFGGKYVLLEPLVAAIAWKLRRPVAAVLTRREDFLATTPAPQSRFDLTLGATRGGRLTALQARVVFDAGAFPGAPLGLACLTLGSYYRVPHFDIRGWEVRTHKQGSGAYRAPGAVQASFALESTVDELARRLGIDPLELRLINAVDDGDPMANGKPWPPIGFRACLERLRERRPAFLQSLPPPAAGMRRGVGIAAGGWVGGVEPAGATCRLNGDGSFSVVVGSVDVSGTNTVLGQITAETLGVAVDRVQVVNADTDSAPWAGASGGSKITYTVGAAVKQAAEDARRQILAIAAEELEVSADDLELVDGAVRVRGMPDRHVTLATIADRSSGWNGRREPVLGQGRSAPEARAPGFAVHLAVVDVEPETGAVRPVRHLVVQDVGRALNPAAIEGQITGAVAQGVGWALTERMAYDDDGRLLTATLLDYGLPAVDQVPPVEAMLVEVPSESGPFGARGVGEPPVVGAAAAIANAVAGATGTRPEALPITSATLATTAGGS